MDCNCPAPTSLTEIPAQDCGVNLKQIQRIAFQRSGNVFGDSNTTANSILTLADWQALMTATDSSKIVVTPLIGANPVIEPGDAITNGGGDNSTMNGVEEVEGTNPAKFTCEFKELAPATEKALKALMCEKNLTAYFLLEGGKIAAVEVDATNHKGFGAQSLFLSDRGNQGFATKDTHTFSFSIPAGYSEDLKKLSPTFNPLTEL